MQLPTVDLAAAEVDVIETMHQACQQYGFFYVKNHGIPQTVIDAAFEQTAAFFRQPAAAKAAVAARAGRTSGYHAIGSVTVHKTQRAPDSREVHRVALTDVDASRDPAGAAAAPAQLLAGPAAEGLPLWPPAAALPGFQHAVLDYYAAVGTVSDRLLRAAAAALGLAPSALLDVDAGARGPAWRTLALLHYAPEASAPDAGRLACGAHKDRFCHFTLLANAPGSRGLEAQARDGSWFEVLPRPGCLIINVGSLLEAFSGGAYRAVVHRVNNPSDVDRYSIAYFRGCAFDTVVRPLVGPQAARAAATTACAPDNSGSGTAAASALAAQSEADYADLQYPPFRFGDYMNGFDASFKGPAAAAAAAAAAPAAA